MLNQAELEMVNAFLGGIEDFDAFALSEQTSVLVYCATVIAGHPAVTGSDLDKVRQQLHLAPANSSKYLTEGSKESPRRFLKRPRGYVLHRPEQQRIAAMRPAPAPIAPSVPRAVVLTALRLEFEAVNEYLVDVVEQVHPAGTVYNRGALVNPAELQWEIIVAEVGAGNVGAALEAERAINHFRPDVALFLGVAGGVKDVRIGDIVIATKVYGYESGKSRAQGFIPRPDVGRSSYRLEQRAKAEARKAEWRKWASGHIDHSDASVYVGPIAAGEKVVSSNRAQVAEFLKNWYSDALAVEMEGRGFLEATHSNHLDAAVIRGVSDLLSGKAASDRAGNQKVAARRAAAFAMYLLTRFTPPRFTAPTAA